MFGWKKKYDQLKADHDVLYDAHDDAIREIKHLDQTIREMADEIRNMDQLIYQMSQCTDWSSMRPLFNELQAKQSRRQREESNRITDILRRELISVYKEPSE